MKFIFRKLTSRKEKLRGRQLRARAEILLAIADRYFREESGRYSDTRDEIYIRYSELMNEAAKCFGFRNIDELELYEFIHGVKF